MEQFAALLDALVYTSSRNAKPKLLADYLRRTPDPDRGWTLAALTDGLDFPAVKSAVSRNLLMERVDPVLYALSRDYVGDTAETASLLWPQPPHPPSPPTVSEAVDILAGMTRAMADRSGEMEIFVTAVREGSLSAAARRLELTPSAVSRAPARVEVRLGVRLLARTTPKLGLTPEGDAYLHAAQRILADITEVEEELADQASPRGRLRVSTSLRVVRCSSSTPSSSSSAATARLTDEVGTDSERAALVKLPLSTTRTNMAARFRSIVAMAAIYDSKVWN